VYVITDGTYYKIGKANNPNLRLSSLQTANTNKLRLLCTITCDSSVEALALEATLHTMLFEYKHLHEWFNIEYSMLLNLLQPYDPILQSFYHVTELTERINMRNLFRTLATTLKSSNDILILGEILHETNVINDIIICNISTYATRLGVSRSTLNALLQRATDANLFHKVDTGQYMVNPFMFMGAPATDKGYQQQELVQARWKELTGLLTDLEIQQLLNLRDYLGLPYLAGTDFNINVARYYASHNTITIKQRAALIKRLKTQPVPQKTT